MNKKSLGFVMKIILDFFLQKAAKNTEKYLENQKIKKNGKSHFELQQKYLKKCKKQ
ncbi:MAG: hypothetical protein R3Y21_05490 [Mycoplasmatota bacterium]